MAKILIVEARFYEAIADELVAGATAAIEAKGHEVERISVPGAFEIPAAIKFASESSEGFAGYLALGCVIRGETTHYDYVCGECSRGMADLAMQGLPVGFGVLTVENREQAHARADRDKGNKGAEAAEACLRMLELKERFHG